MYPILKTEALNGEVTRMVVEAPAIARKIQPGQFIMLRIDERGERIPLTMNEADPEAGTVTIVFQAVGATTMRLAKMRAGQSLLDFSGPFGKPTELEGVRKACVIGGGLGTAIAYPQAKWLFDHGAQVDVILGFRTKDLIILEDELRACSTTCTVVTDDGSNGNKGLVTQPLAKRIAEGADYDAVLAVGPVIMMKFVAETTREPGIRTLVSMNPLMIDGTGMCGGCRVKVGDEYLHACVDGPDFDGHQVDFDDAMRRGVMYRSFEQVAVAALNGEELPEGRECAVTAEPLVEMELSPKQGTVQAETAFASDAEVAAAEPASATAGAPVQAASQEVLPPRNKVNDDWRRYAAQRANAAWRASHETYQQEKVAWEHVVQASRNGAGWSDASENPMAHSKPGYSGHSGRRRW